MLKLENRNFTMIEQLCKNLVINNVTWDPKKIMESHKKGEYISIYILNWMLKIFLI